MKYSLAALPALAAVALAQAPSPSAAVAQPAFRNEAFPIKEDRVFTIRYSGCEDGCTIELRNGLAGNLQPVMPITTDARGTSYDWTPKNLPSDTYTLQITSNKGGPPNYSIFFPYQGTGAAVSASASAASSPSAAETPTASLPPASSGSSSVASATSATLTSASSSVMLSTAARETTEAESSSASRNSTATRSGSSSSMRPSSSATTKIPESGVSHVSVPLALAGVAAVMAYLF